MTPSLKASRRLLVMAAWYPAGRLGNRGPTAERGRGG